ncbi:hypothetical protein [Pseudorhodobacter sp. MZDSW-24AT]|uniref:hypothetical protein n=1 Tax=Pseudorhodobacter sp. MZDSW-24AT TaxID=2052957 RepID=UPI000C1DCB0D|nr:hypothetical protein [Pseudorhodobacter sp. MZDSW-24AT]PJF09586.1 hypothetical protein CUR21_06685 [Pseudorhodobacter sp. MZDSW-24AT]
MRRSLVLLVLLAACGTPQERCIARETRDMRVLDRLIAESEGNLARGYALEEVVTYRDRWVQCPVVLRPAPAEGEPAPVVAPQLCLDEVAETVTRPKAIDLRAEAQKLESMREKRVALARAAGPAIAQCKAQFPE